MRRYTFLLLAFFLSITARAEGLGFSTSMMGVSAAPQGIPETTKVKRNKKIGKRVAYVNPRNVKETSPRNINELGNLKESSQRTQGEATVNTQLNSMNTGVPDIAEKQGQTAQSAVSCKTYEGKSYDKGEPGYNDCIRTIKTDRQIEETVP